MHLMALAASVLGIEVDELVHRLRRNAMAIGVVAFFALVGVVFLLVALNAWFSAMWGPVVGPLVIGIGGMVVAALTWAGVSAAEAIARRRAAEKRSSAEKTALVTTAALTALPLVLRSSLMRRVGLPVGGALAAAFLLARSGESHETEED